MVDALCIGDGPASGDPCGHRSRPFRRNARFLIGVRADHAPRRFGTVRLCHRGATDRKGGPTRDPLLPFDGGGSTFVMETICFLTG